MKLFIPCQPGDVKGGPFGTGVEVQLRPAFEAKRPSELAMLIAESPEEERGMPALSMDLQQALPRLQFDHGRGTAEMVLIAIYQPKR